MYASIKELSPAVRTALEAVHYRRADIRIEPRESIVGAVAGGSGARGFVCIVNLDSGQSRVKWGSWGGDNLFSSSPVDSSREAIEIPPNGAVIKGTKGHGGTFATIYVHPQGMGGFLPSGEPEDVLSDADQQAIYCFAAIKGGEYRREEMRRRGVTEDVVNSLVERGYLKRNKSGATQITTKGKNARTIRY